MNTPYEVQIVTPFPPERLACLNFAVTSIPVEACYLLGDKVTIMSLDERSDWRIDDWQPEDRARSAISRRLLDTEKLINTRRLRDEHARDEMVQLISEQANIPNTYTLIEDSLSAQLFDEEDSNANLITTGALYRSKHASLSIHLMELVGAAGRLSNDQLHSAKERLETSVVPYRSLVSSLSGQLPGREGTVSDALAVTNAREAASDIWVSTVANRLKDLSSQIDDNTYGSKLTAELLTNPRPWLEGMGAIVLNSITNISIIANVLAIGVLTASHLVKADYEQKSEDRAISASEAYFLQILADEVCEGEGHKEFKISGSLTGKAPKGWKAGGQG